MPTPRFAFNITEKFMTTSGWITAIVAAFQRIEDVGALLSDVAGAEADASAALLAHRQAPVLDHPDDSILARHLSDNSVTDPIIGTRTIANGGLFNITGTLTSFLLNIYGILSSVTGVAGLGSGVTIPTSLAAAAAHYTANGSHEFYYGNGDPEGVQAAPVGAIYRRRDPTSGASALWSKVGGGAGATGWKRAGMNIKSIQRGTIALNVGQGIVDAAITGVVTASSVCLYNGATSTDNGEVNQSASGNVSVQLLDNTHVRAQRANSATDAVAYYTVVEYE